MMLVTFGEGQPSIGVGETRLVPDDVAGRLDREGALSGMQPWPPEASAPAAPATPRAPARPTPQPTRRSGNRDQRSVR